MRFLQVVGITLDELADCLGWHTAGARPPNYYSAAPPNPAFPQFGRSVDPDIAAFPRGLARLFLRMMHTSRPLLNEDLRVRLTGLAPSPPLPAAA